LVVTRRVASENLLTRSWDGQTVVYDRYAGDTHCLDRVASAVLLGVMQGNQADDAELLDRIQALLPAESAVSPDMLTAALAELERLRLVRTSG
jgi:PqqD family protein of HPr-rel-A system